MFASALEARGQANDLARVHPGRGGHRDDAGLSLGERARLVEDERVDGPQRLEGTRVFEEDAHGRAAADADHDRHRRREPERAGARDDEDGHGVHERMRETRLGTGEGPHDEREQRGREHRGDEDSGDAVGEPLDRRPAPLRVADELNDLSEERVASDAPGLDDEAAGSVDRSRRDRRAMHLGHRAAARR